MLLPVRRHIEARYGREWDRDETYLQAQIKHVLHAVQRGATYLVSRMSARHHARQHRNPDMRLLLDVKFRYMMFPRRASNCMGDVSNLTLDQIRHTNKGSTNYCTDLVCGSDATPAMV